MNTHRLAVATDECLQIVSGARAVALVGISANEQRASYFVLSYLTQTALDIYPINPKYREIMGIRCYPNLASLPITPDIVVIFRKAEFIPPIVEEAVRVGARNVWFQLGLKSELGARLAVNAGMGVVQDRCIKLEHARWAGKLRWIGASTGVIDNRRKRKL